MAEPTAAHTRELGDYVSMVRRRWGWVVACVLAGLLLGFAYLAYANVTYSSTAKVLVKQTSLTTTNSGTAKTNNDINLDTEAQLVRSEPVATRAGELLGTDTSPVTLANRVRVAVPPNTTVLAITYSAGNAADAQKGAEMFARAYLENRQAGAQSDVDAQVNRLKKQIDETTQNLEDTTAALARLQSSANKANRAFLTARRAALGNELSSLNSQLAPLVGTEVQAGQVIVAAQEPSRPINPNPLLILPAGLMLGLVVGLGLAAWRERSDKRIHSRAEVERVFGITPLALADSALAGTGSDHDVVALYHQLRAEAPDQNERVVLVGPDDPETAETLAYSLAVVAARSGVDTTYVARPDSAALVERRRTHTDKSGLLQLPDYAELNVLVDGELRLAELRERVGELSADREFVILGLPNDDPAVDLPVLARHVDVAVVVIRLGKSERSSIGAVLSVVSKFGVDHVVAVTVERRRRRNAPQPVVVEDAAEDAMPSVDVPPLVPARNSR